MSERLRAMGDDDLGAALSSLDIDWPSYPALRTAVMARAAIGADRPSCAFTCPAPGGSC